MILTLRFNFHFDFLNFYFKKFTLYFVPNQRSLVPLSLLLVSHFIFQFIKTNLRISKRWNRSR
ncbi:hypothetical protein CH367_19725 [Leptospira barantonii]|uniref:Uncharacterized protein n=1 Tax=Leptospira barantonii TaxID=2023184 RepID=A0ABX4NFW2_9LEPT|nr:hypothetical protein CH367_19725 [Leptospira barantonii]